MATSIVLMGMDRLTRILVSGGPAAVDATRRALYEEAQIVLGKSKRIVPFHYGTLAGSGRVHEPQVAGRDILVEISYGGPAASRDPKNPGPTIVGYAEIQHETERFNHAPGRRWKYLEEPTLEAQKTLGDRITKRVDAILNGLI